MCSMAALPGGKRQNVCDRYPGHESGERRERWPGYEGMSLPVDSSHKAALPSLPLESTYWDRETWFSEF